MTTSEENINIHICKYCCGKMLNIDTDNNGNAYCHRCGKKLLDTQLTEKALNFVNIIRKRR